MSNLIQAILKRDSAKLTKEATGFTYRPTKQELVASNNTLNLATMQAHSYGHWCYFRIIDGLAVFNDYRYSNTTARHQHRMRQLLRKLGIAVAVTIETHGSIGYYSLRDVQSTLDEMYRGLEADLATCKRAKSMKLDNIIWRMGEVRDSMELVAQHRRLQLRGVS